MKNCWCLLLFVPLAAASGAQTPAAQQVAVLQQMDAASRVFKNARANFEWKYYERIVHDTSIQSGYIYFERNGNSTSMGAVVESPGRKVLQYRDGTLQMLDPGVNQITVIDAGASRAQTESFLTLGFGGSGTELAKAWNITDQGTEMLEDGGKPVKVTKLDLIAKDPAARSTFTHVTIWVDASRGVSLKQMFFTPSGDYRTAIYSHVMVNGSIDKGKFALKKNGSTTVIHR